MIFLCLLLVVAGCASNSEKTGPQFEATKTYLGFTTKQLIQAKGAPSSVAVLPTGGSVWTYKTLKTVEKGISGSVSWNETTSFIIDGSGTVKSYTTAVE